MSEPVEPIAIASDRLSVEISPEGAQLQRLRDEEGRDLLWDGDPRFWTGRAPILFPVIGCTNGSHIRVDGRDFPIGKHGFARRSRFAVAEQSAEAVTFRLEASDETRAHYPFDFGLDIRFAAEGGVLAVEATLQNPAAEPLPASFGFHPALRWPLPYGGERGAHHVRFERDEPAPIRRIGTDQLLAPEPLPTPVAGDLLRVRDELFEDDALIFDRLSSRSVLFGAPGTRAVRVSFPAMPMLGIWTKPGAGFLCIEPWQGIADPEGFTGEYRDKPGVVEIAAGAERVFGYRIDTDAGVFPADG